MYTIDINDKGKLLISYESEILPMVGDTIAGIEFEDGVMRSVVSRQVFTHTKNSICIRVEPTFPRN